MDIRSGWYGSDRPPSPQFWGTSGSGSPRIGGWGAPNRIGGGISTKSIGHIESSSAECGDRLRSICEHLALYLTIMNRSILINAERGFMRYQKYKLPESYTSRKAQALGNASAPQPPILGEQDRSRANFMLTPISRSTR